MGSRGPKTRTAAFVMMREKYENSRGEYEQLKEAKEARSHKGVLVTFTEPKVELMFELHVRRDM
jgi:hypothetical protein